MKSVAPNGGRKATGRKPSAKLELTRLRILDAAAKVFSRKSYHLALLRDIAEEAGIHVTALYYHFDNKEQLVEAMMNRLATSGHERVLAAVEALPESATHRERIAAAARAQLASILVDREYMSAHARVLRQIPDEVLERHRAVLRQGFVFWRKLIKEAWKVGEIRKELDPTLATQILLGSLNWSAEWYRPGRLSPDQIAMQTVALVFDGMAPRETAKRTRSRAAPAHVK